MKLKINRSQSIGNKGSVRFAVSFKLETSDYEIKLINTYSNMTKILGRVGDYCLGGQVKTFTSEGVRFESDSLVKMLEVEQKVREDIEQLNSFLKTADSYRGSEDVEFD